MDRRVFLAGLAGCTGFGFSVGGCRGRPYAHILRKEDPDLVGTTAAGAATYRPLIETAVSSLLSRHAGGGATLAGTAAEKIRICFLGVENRSAEELGDFKYAIYEQIDTCIERSNVYRPISRRFVESALREARLRPDQLFLPHNRRTFAAVLESKGQPVDYLLFARITTGTTEANRDYQRDYLLTLELVNVATGDYDKETALLRKRYHR